VRVLFKPSPASETRGALELDNPYLAARHEWGERYGNPCVCDGEDSSGNVRVDRTPLYSWDVTEDIAPPARRHERGGPQRPEAADTGPQRAQET